MFQVGVAAALSTPPPRTPMDGRDQKGNTMARTRKWNKGLATFSDSRPCSFMCMTVAINFPRPRVNRSTRIISPKSTGLEVGKRGLLHITDSSCYDFCEKIKSNKDSLKKVLTTEKHGLENV